MDTDRLKEIRKALIAFFGALGTWGATAAADGAYSQVELWGLCAVVVTGLSTYGVRNHATLRSSSRTWAGHLTNE